MKIFMVIIINDISINSISAVFYRLMLVATRKEQGIQSETTVCIKIYIYTLRHDEVGIIPEIQDCLHIWKAIKEIY